MKLTAQIFTTIYKYDYKQLQLQFTITANNTVCYGIAEPERHRLARVHTNNISPEKKKLLEMWANAQRDGCPVEHR